MIPALTPQVGGYELDPIRLKTAEGWDMQVTTGKEINTPASFELFVHISNTSALPR